MKVRSHSEISKQTYRGFILVGTPHTTAASLMPLFLLTMNKGFVIILGVIILMLFAIVVITVLVSHKHDMEMINANKKGCTEKDDKQLYICDYADLCSQNIGNCYKSKIAYKRKNNKKTNR